jgi:hypothetical protein
VKYQNAPCVLGPDNAFWIDGEWLSWSDIPDPDDDAFSRSHLARLEYEAELRHRFPKADIALVPYYTKLLALARDYHEETGRHMQIYGELGELFGAITYGIVLHKAHAKGSDGRLGDDFVEIKTITPFKRSDVVTLLRDRHFSKVLVVRISPNFDVSGKMFDRSELPGNGGKVIRLRYSN